MPYVGRIIRERDSLEASLRQMQFPPGHFYSPIPSREEIRARARELFEEAADRRDLPGIDLNEAAQLELLDQLVPLAADQPFGRWPQAGLRYYFDNGYFSYTDGLLLYGLLRLLRPRRVVEIGSGFSSCLMLDTIDRHLAGRTACIFIEPFPERLRKRLRAGDLDGAPHRLLELPLQAVDPAVFEELGPDDLLFVDSTHVSKTGSDVNRILFEIVPRLRPGVWVHFHDIFWPFEYSLEHIEQGLAWNEAYFLRAFLQFNPAFEIRLYARFLHHFHGNRLRERLPLTLEDRGCSLWIRRTS